MTVPLSNVAGDDWKTCRSPIRSKPTVPEYLYSMHLPVHVLGSASRDLPCRPLNLHEAQIRVKIFREELQSNHDLQKKKGPVKAHH
ncbi:hypothetical protein SMMN14_07265 [Sphaerulina musiva]